MAHSSLTNKTILNIKDCVAELKRAFFAENTIITDDSPALHRLEEKLEFVLLIGLKEKPGVFGGKRSYWDYISACLSSTKRPHQGLKFVKSNSELKSSLGRGRAFLRFCLMQHCLADTLQSCFVNKKNTRDFYLENCLPLQHKLWSSLVSYLYDLNEIHFDLNPQHAELDVSWPSFARKLFLSSESKILPEDLSARGTDFSMVSENVDACTSQDILDNKRIQNSLNEASSNSICVIEELDFTPRNELLKRNSHSFPSCLSINNNQHSQKENNLNHDSCKFFNSCTKEFTPGLVSLTSVNLINDEIDSFPFLKNNCIDISEHIPQSTSKLFFELKGIVDMLRNSMCTYSEDSETISYFKHLKNALDSLEINYLKDIEKCKKLNITKQPCEDFLSYLKSLALKQVSVMSSLSEKINSSIEESKSLCEKMNILKERLNSYGLLKFETEDSSKIQDILPVHEISASDINWNIEFVDYTSQDSLESLCILKESLSKLNSLSIQAKSFQLWLYSAHKLNDNLISRIQDQEIHMRGITKELEEAHHLLSVMRKQHKKLQSAESIIKYDLQEKRKLLTRLKHQLESTHEDCKIVRIKNSQSELECQNLRREFAFRNKQTSEESGFVDDKVLDDNCAIINVTLDQNVIHTIPNKEVTSDIKDIESRYILKKNRLQALEEQCKLLCSNLINSSKKQQEIDGRLETWCLAIDNSNKVSHTKTEKLNNINVNQDFESETDEMLNENIIDSGSDVNSSLISSGIGSVNSDCSSIPHNSNTLTISHLKYIQTDDLVESTNLSDDCNRISNPICKAMNIKNFEIMENPSLCSSIESLEGVEDSSILSQDNSEGNSLSCIDIELPETISYDMHKSTVLETDISNLCEENKALKTRCQELEKISEILSKQLDLKSQQLKFSEATKEKEITALQFQLNSEILKYEKALKEYSTNNDDLNDMKQKVNDQEELIFSLEEALAEIQSERENIKDQQWGQLQDIQFALAAREEECILLSADLEKLENFKKYCLSDRQIMENELTHLRIDSKDLQKKIIKLLKEKDILWKRNDHLTFLQKIQISDRWMNDHEVSQCLGCKSNFSFLLRKHHCRQCGRIFCYSCSNNWLLTASSKKQIRICNECYKQHLEIKNVVRRDSNVQCCEDSDDEIADMPLIKNEMFGSASNPSICDSVMSLPAMQVLEEKCQFTSVPNLYRAVEEHNNTNQLEDAKNGKLCIKAGEEAELFVSNEENTMSLHWRLFPNNEAIPVSLIYENTLTSQQVVLHQSACETEGVMHVTLPGLYKLCFNNSSRLTSLSVYYTFTKEQEITN